MEQKKIQIAHDPRLFTLVSIHIVYWISRAHVLWLILIVPKIVTFICFERTTKLYRFLLSFLVCKNEEIFFFFSISITLTTCTKTYTYFTHSLTHSLKLLRCNKIPHTNTLSMCALIIINNLWRKATNRIQIRKNKKRSLCCCQNQDQQTVSRCNPKILFIIT